MLVIHHVHYLKMPSILMSIVNSKNLLLRISVQAVVYVSSGVIMMLLILRVSGSYYLDATNLELDKILKIF